MKPCNLILLSLLLLCNSVFAQSRISGTVSDTSQHVALGQSPVILLQQKDSFLVAFTRTDKDGKFELKNIKPGNYLLKISYPKYADFVLSVSMDSGADKNFQDLSMTLKSKLLEEVVIHGNFSAIKIKGDTTEFKADSFKTQVGATVEDLLRRLPGIQVDNNGKITAQGQTVQKVLVDGEEFFGDDPTLVTQNLKADMVDKVQVFDKKSDQAVFTGIDDGQKTKTINITTKDGKKNGYFGKAEAGLGTGEYYNYNVMFNDFEKKMKFAAYGIVSNTGKTGLNNTDNQSYGSSSAADYFDVDEAGGLSYIGNAVQDDLDSWTGQYSGQGLPAVKTAGVHYNNKWNADKLSMNFNYKIFQLDVTGTSQTNTQYLLPDSSYYISQTTKNKNSILKNKLNGVFDWKPDSSSAIKVTVDGKSDHKISSTDYLSENRGQDSFLVNRNGRSENFDGIQNTLNTTVNYKKRLKKKGRSFALVLKENYSSDNTNGYLKSNTNFYKDGAVDSSQLIDQYKTFSSENLAVDARLVYTEPVSKFSFLSVNYGVVNSNSSAHRNSYNPDGSGKFKELDSLYSNNYHFNIFTNLGGLQYIFTRSKFNVRVGNNIGFTKFRQEDLDSNLLTRRSFVNWYPSASISYKVAQQANLYMYYNGNTTQPSIDNLQPVRNNQDPLNVKIGNPLLRPSFENSYRLQYYSYNILSSTSMYLGANLNTTSAAITTRDSVDIATGKRIYQPVNVNGNYNAQVYSSFSLKWKKTNINFDILPSFGINRYTGYVNGVQNQTNSNTYGLGLYANTYKDQSYIFRIELSGAYTTSNSSVQSALKTAYWTYNIHPYLDYLFLPIKYKLRTGINYNFRQKTSAFDKDVNTAVWDASIEKKVLKNKNLVLTLSVNDLLNQNIGFSRSTNSNIITQNQYSTVQRFFMFSVIWAFNKSGIKAPVL